MVFDEVILDHVFDKVIFNGLIGISTFWFISIFDDVSFDVLTPSLANKTKEN